MKYLRKWYWFLSTYVKKYGFGIAVGLVIGALAFTNGPTLLKYLPIKSTSHIGRVGAYTLGQLPLDIQQKISRGLTTIDANGKVSLDAAQTMSVSNEGTEYTFTLKPDNYWSTGEKVRSLDINLNLRDVTIEHPTDDVITLKLKEPFAPFPSILSQPIMRRITTGFPFKKTQVVGLNSYAISNIKTVNQTIASLTLTSKEDTLVYHFFPTEEEALNAYKLGRVDQLDYLSAPYLEDWVNTKVTTNTDSKRYLTLFFNTADPNLQDKTIRQLLTYATPKKIDDTRVISPIDRKSWAYNSQVKPYDYSLDTAKNMLAKLKQTNANLQLSLEVTTTPAYASAAQLIIDSWQQLGVVAKLKIVAFPDPSNYQILLIGQQIPDDPDQYLLWHSTQPTNITKYQNPKIDKLLEDARKELDPEKRKQLYQDFQRFLVEDCPAAFLNQLYTYNLKRV